MFGDIIQPTHLIFILVVALVVLGPKRLPEVGRSLGRGLRDFRQGLQGVEAEARGVFRDTLDESHTHTDPAETSTQPEFSQAVSMAPTPHFVVSPAAQSGPATASSSTAGPAAATGAAPDPADHAA
jgi:sec-independent protein translocase protein TatA